MKKVLSLALALILCLSLAACGGLDAETKAKLELFDKYADLIEAFEAHDEEAVAGAFEFHWTAAGEQDGNSGEITEPEWPSDEENVMIYQYMEILRQLNNYTETGELVSYEQVGDDMVDYGTQETLGRFYEQLQNMSVIDKWLQKDLPEHYVNAFDGLEKDREAVLARFTVLPDQLLKITQEIKDNMGNVMTQDILECQYDAEGRPANLETMNGWKYFNYTKGSLIPFCKVYDEGHITYDSNGRIEKVVEKSSDIIQAIYTPVYDENGNMVSCMVKKNSGEYENTYTYDENGLLIEASINNDLDPIDSYTCSYDEQGRLLKEEVGPENGGYTSSCTYTYDESGRLQSVELLKYWRGSPTDIDIYESSCHTYTYDDQGRIQSVHIVPGEAGSNNNFAEINQTYTYGPVYYYAGK